MGLIKLAENQEILLTSLSKLLIKETTHRGRMTIFSCAQGKNKKLKYISDPETNFSLLAQKIRQGWEWVRDVSPIFHVKYSSTGKILKYAYIYINI